MIDLLGVAADVFTLATLTAIVVGTLLGIVIGALPGLGSVVGISICLPFTFGMAPLTSISLLLGVYCGSVYGGSISAILINTPGTPQAAATSLDGYPMAVRGEAARAIGWATAASVAGGLFSCALLIAAAPQLARFAVHFGSVEVFALILLALTCIAAVSSNSLIKGLLMGTLGLFIALIGADPVTGAQRFTFGIQHLAGGVDLIAVVVGLFALSEAFSRIAVLGSPPKEVLATWMRLPGLRDWRGRWRILGQSSLIGSVVGALPGTGAATAAFIAYAFARQTSANGQRFGDGEPDGIIAAESSNNAVTGSAMIPTLALGIPGDVVTAILLGAFVIHGIVPGVRLMTEHADTVNGLFLSLILINLVMLLLAFPVVRLFGRLLAVPQRYILTGVVVLSLIGTAAVRGSPYDPLVAVLFGIVGFVLRRHDYPLAPLVIGLVLGPQLEAALRRGLLIHDNDFLAFLTHSWISATLFAGTLLMIVLTILHTRLGRQNSRSATENTHP